jgi:hypothetical protein
MLATDSVLTAMILTGLLRAKTGWSTTDKVVSRLIRYVAQIIVQLTLTSRVSVEAQVPATMEALGFLLTFAITTKLQKGSLLIYFWLIQLPKVYLVSLLGESLSFYSPAILTTSCSKLPKHLERDYDWRIWRCWLIRSGL